MKFSGTMPDITPAQIAAIATFVIGQLVAFGVLDPAREQLAVSLGATLIAVALKVADAVIRSGRARGVASGLPAQPPAARKV